jgi:hypothetical protein
VGAAAVTVAEGGEGYGHCGRGASVGRESRRRERGEGITAARAWADWGEAGARAGEAGARVSCGR